ncbi:MAG: hypothetical protein LBC18_14850 [Opitutaceae bacterium]|jgi:SAM-dependent methyltransferase|nr:hypothetical protein [Opitutaceae bacterium]
MFQPRFARPVEAWTKRQTIRARGARVIRPGDLLDLREWTGLPYRSKQRRLGLAECTSVDPVFIGQYALPVSVSGEELCAEGREHFARADGFENLAQMHDWFSRVHGLPFTGNLIKWQPVNGAPKSNATVLDACCGSRMFHFEKDSPDILYVDNRDGVFSSRDPDRRGGVRVARVQPDIVADFTALPFADGRFRVVIFDPPHLGKIGDRSIMRAIYGRLPKQWQALIEQGFRECFRVLAPHGLLIFKWNATQIPVSKILILTPHTPLVGQRCGKAARTHWLIFKKQGEQNERKETTHD